MAAKHIQQSGTIEICGHHYVSICNEDVYIDEYKGWARVVY